MSIRIRCTSQQTETEVLDRNTRQIQAAVDPVGREGNPSMMVPEGSVLVLIDPRPLIRDCLANCLRASEGGSVLAFASVTEWQESPEAPAQAGLVLLCIESGKHGLARMEHELSILSHNASKIPVIVIADIEDIEQVRFALNGGARGYIPTSVTFDIAVGAIHLVKVGGTFVPASALVCSEHGETAADSCAGHANGLLTDREVAVLEALRMGRTNKRIAFDLNMTEGTVKVHVRNIMKKLHATNRTEVVVLTSPSLR